MRSVTVRRRVLAGLVVALLLAGCSDPNVEANKLFVEARKLLQGANRQEPEAQLKSLTEAEQRLKQIMEKYPSSNLAVQLASGQSVGEVSLRQVEAAILKSKRIFKECPECPEMVVVPEGSFTMGSPASEAGRDSGEGPQRQVTIPKAFAAGKYEVTFEEWDACVAGGGCNGYRPDDQGWGRGRRPAIDVSWDDAKAYVQWLSRWTGKPYRLLSEAEWEYAARGGTTTPFHFGSTIAPDRANYDGNYSYGGGPKGVYRRRTVAVGSFAANPFSLYDVHGNVWEWVEDCWHESYHGAPVDGSAWTSGGDCDLRVLRGGSWDGHPRDVRSAIRGWNPSDLRTYNDGFRVARTL